MASAFTMLGMLRRTTAKRRGTTASQESTASTPATTSSALPSIDATLTASPSSSPPSTTTVPPPAPSSIATHSTESELDLSDSASIISASSITSKKAKKKRSPSMLLRGFSLSRKPSVGSGLSQSQATQPHVNTNVPAASILSPILASPIDAEGSGFTHEPEGIEGQGQGLARKVSSDGFSVVSHHDEEVQQPKVEKVDREEGDWTEVVESFPTPPPSVSTPPPAIATTGHDEEPNSLSFNDAEELTSAEEELKKASAKVKVLEGTLAEREVEKHRLEEEIRGVAAEKARLESMVHGIEARLKEVEDRGRDEQKEKERLGRELLRVRGENNGLSKSLQDQIDRLKALEDRYAQQEVEKSRLEASLASLLQEKDKLAAKARADAESLKETKARYARQELEKGGVKAELQSMSKEKEAAALKLYSVTQQLEDARRDYEDECAKVEHLEEEAKLLQDEKRRLEGKANQLGEEKKRVEGEAKRLEVELQNRTLEGEKSALEAKEASEELDHLYKRYAEQDDELNRLKEELHRTSAANKELVQAGLDAARTATEINEKLVELEKTVREERQRVFDAHAAETRKLKGDLQAGTAIAEELLRTAREMKRENEGLNGRMKEMKRSFDEDRRRMLEDHENSVRRPGQEERQRAAEERRALVEDYEGRMRQLKEGWEEAVAKTGRELVETRTRLVEEHAAEVERLKEANWDLEALTTTMAEDHKVAKKKWEDEKKALKTEWYNERSAWAKEREQASKVHNELNRLLESEKADHREFKSSVDKTFEEMRARTSNELAKSNEALRRKREQVSELDSRLQRVRKEVNDLKVWQAKAAEAAGEAARLRKAVQKMAGQTDSAVFEDQARRQASADIRFSRPSTSRRGSGSADAIEPVDAALSVLYALNSEIFQAAASLADTIEGSPPPAGLIDTVNDFGALMEKVAPFLSEELVVSLRSAYSESSDGPNPLILQVAFQACLAYSCNRFITSWYPIHWEYGRFLEVMHGRLIDAGAIPEADSFRSTTRALLRLTSESHPKMVSYLRNSVLDILSIIGRPSSGPATETMLELFEEKFAVISRLAIRLHILFNDTPSNLETFLAKPMAQFMEDRMEDTYGDEDDLYSTDAANLKNVICTSEIGLQRVAVRNGADESVIMKPKVILAAILNQEW